jgi:hypothetical protein
MAHRAPSEGEQWRIGRHREDMPASGGHAKTRRRVLQRLMPSHPLCSHYATAPTSSDSPPCPPPPPCRMPWPVVLSPLQAIRSTSKESLR